MPSEKPFSTVARHDIYRSIHKALRHEMFGTLVALGRADVHRDTDLTRIQKRIALLLDAMRSHAQHENEYIHPAIEVRAPGASLRISAQHNEHMEAIETLERQNLLLLVAVPDEREKTVQHLYRLLALFIADNLLHMHAEETSHNALLWSHYSDAEIAGIEQDIVTTLTQEELDMSLRWIAESASPQELALMS